jgi:hypothetical protein
MSNREFYHACAKAEREAAMFAPQMESFRAHMELAREFEWLAATEPYDEPQEAPRMQPR